MELLHKANQELHLEWMAHRNPEYVVCSPEDYDDLRYKRFMLRVFVVCDDRLEPGKLLVCDKPAAYVRGYSEVP